MTSTDAERRAAGTLDRALDFLHVATAAKGKVQTRGVALALWVWRARCPDDWLLTFGRRPVPTTTSVAVRDCMRLTTGSSVRSASLQAQGERRQMACVSKPSVLRRPPREIQLPPRAAGVVQAGVESCDAGAARGAPGRTSMVSGIARTIKFVAVAKRCRDPRQPTDNTRTRK